jgi:hypothetical protein
VIEDADDPQARVRSAREPDGVVESLAGLRTFDVADTDRDDLGSVVPP